MFLNFSGFEFNAANAVGDMVSKHMLKKSLQKLYRLTIHIIVYVRMLINISQLFMISRRGTSLDGTDMVSTAAC